MSREDEIRSIMNKGRKWRPVYVLVEEYQIKTGRVIEPETMERRLRGVDGVTWDYRKDRSTGEEVKHYALIDRVELAA